MVASAENDTAEVTKIPGEDRRLSGFGHGHDRQVGQVGTGVLVPRSKFQRHAKFGFGWSVKSVDAVE